LARTRIQLDETEIHTNLLHIEPGGSVPEHTHKGFELTVLLEGSFHDDHDKYVKGDFIMLDSSHQHHPVSPEGCLCYTVANDALHFTQGINKLLNPIGSFIY
jgi:putative transcriptional regulator